MGRAILSVIAGYLAMAAIVFVGLTGAYLALGADRSFKPGTYDITVLWLVVSFVVGIVAAIAGGWVCRKIARRDKPANVLAGIVLVLGIIMAVWIMSSQVATLPPRTADVSNLDAMFNARTPCWVEFLNAIIGCIGVLVGAGIAAKGRGPAAPSAPPAA